MDRIKQSLTEALTRARAQKEDPFYVFLEAADLAASELSQDPFRKEAYLGKFVTAYHNNPHVTADALVDVAWDLRQDDYFLAEALNEEQARLAYPEVGVTKRTVLAKPELTVEEDAWECQVRDV